MGGFGIDVEYCLWLVLGVYVTHRSTLNTLGLLHYTKQQIEEFLILFKQVKGEGNVDFNDSSFQLPA